MSVKFSYFPLYAKGLAPMLVLEHSGAAWEGNLVAFEAWAEMKKSGVCPFGQLPILETPDAGVIGQANAICAHVGKDMLGEDAREKAVSVMLVGAADDIYNELVARQNTVLKKDKVPAEEVEQMWAVSFPYRFECLEKLLNGKDAFTKSGLTVGELTLFSMLYQAVLVKPEALKATPNLAAFHDRILNLPATQRVLTGKTSFGQPNAYFVN